MGEGVGRRRRRRRRGRGEGVGELVDVFEMIGLVGELYAVDY